ncbi:hypothetical protein Q7453_11635 [Glaesserella parasuis]|uniref:hypothetical protein n=1 Tax=Glaesserella parasuis TaxID=738 RepID=UPI00271A2054|nr:hypothetical protein [Glaesserella parasuis]MDO9856597.1 hypothetical protein [Glaesserella parasuis]MDO9858979.1 hypothetical protein [Glaesserella parasuis]MDO9896898.1 hypothetical protein [Glaesserella parasuis]
MINESNKEAILNGACGISRDGYKCRYIGKSGNSEFPYQFVYYKPNEVIRDIANLSEQFRYLKHSKDELDVIGLWENRLEPFDLEKALQGTPVLLRGNKKAYLKFLMPKEYKGPYPIKGYVIDDEYPDGAYTLSWHLNGKATKEDCNHHLDIIGMYKESEPEPNTVTLTLPCPLKEPKDEMWFVDSDGVTRSNYHKNIPLDDFERIPYFGSEADAKVWFDAMQNSRR